MNPAKLKNRFGTRSNKLLAGFMGRVSFYPTGKRPTVAAFQSSVPNDAESDTNFDPGSATTATGGFWIAC